MHREATLLGYDCRCDVGSLLRCIAPLAWETQHCACIHLLLHTLLLKTNNMQEAKSTDHSCPFLHTFLQASLNIAEQTLGCLLMRQSMRRARLRR